ncbi:MAG: hypothetical protein RIB45_08885 [Marivibrio sp.]|uniref:hypothetical protein n=1 Tax=Marivibrio sp. TaxID=2039719 RepID=UPI0032EC3757
MSERDRDHDGGSAKGGPDQAGRQGLNELTQDVLALYMRRVADAVARTGVTTIDPQALESIAERMSRGEDPALQKIYERTWERLQESFEHAFWARMRKYPLERLIVSRFEHKLAPRDEAPAPGETLSRRVIPAFIGALHQMIGPDLFNEYEERSRNLVEAVRSLEGDGAAWDKLYQHPQADVLVNDILVYIARYFTDAPKRRHWLTGYMERSLPSAKTESEKRWVFGDREFHLLLGALYEQLEAQLQKPEIRIRHVKRYGEENVQMVEEALSALARDRRHVGT